MRLAAATGRPVEVLITVAGDADLARTPPAGEHAQKVATAGQRLRDTAARAQAGLVEDLKSRAIEHRAFWVANVVWARAGLAELERIAGRDDVLHIDGNPVVRNRLPQPEAGPQSPDVPNATEWGVNKVRAPEVWATGYTGQGVVIGGQDTGLPVGPPGAARQVPRLERHDRRPQLQLARRHPRVVSGGANAAAWIRRCPATTTTMARTRWAPWSATTAATTRSAWRRARAGSAAATWSAGDGTPATYLECFQWFMAPTDLAGPEPGSGAGAARDQQLLGLPAVGGLHGVACSNRAVDNLRAAGIMVVVSAGNNGSSCGSVQDPPAIYARSFSVGNTTSADSIAGSSSRGPVTIDGSNRLKPDVSAPGTSIRSSIRGGGYANFSGTSMAGPHVAAAAALVMSARPDLRGNPAAVESVLRETAVPLTSTQNCGLYPGSAVPNAVFGSGRIDAFAAVSRVSSDPIFVDGTE